MRNQKFLTAALAASFLTFLSISQASAAGAFAMGREPGRVWFGANSDSDTVEEAMARAMHSCRKHGPCHIETTFWNKCFAFAWQVGEGRNGYGWATRDTPRGAERAAMRSCESHGIDCELQDSRCDTAGR